MDPNLSAPFKTIEETQTISRSGDLVTRDDLNNHIKISKYDFPRTTTGIYIQLKRALYGGGKNNIAIIFPVFLEKDPSFLLCGFIIHRGTMTHGGHYTAFALRDKKWFYFDDSSDPLCCLDINNVIQNEQIQRNVSAIFYNRT